ncbi:MAG: co-chaperone GroES [Clostridia bacterium]|nr:co-chaperone GroES [Clostridia bacterium]MBR1677709.1 co-chaperone GroES [Clostridia bacterium]
MNIKPLFDYLVINAEEKKETTKSGFILPSAAEHKYVTAKVTAVGVGGTQFGKDIVMLVKAGDFVLFPADSIIKVKVGGEEVSIIRQSDVLAVIE